MPRTNFLVQRNVNPHNIFGHFINLKCCSICYHVAVIQIPKFGGYRSVMGWDSNQLKANHDFLIPLSTKFCSICCRLARIPISNYAPPPNVIASGQRKWYQSKCQLHIPIQLHHHHHLPSVFHATHRLGVFPQPSSSNSFSAPLVQETLSLQSF